MYTHADNGRDGDIRVVRRGGVIGSSNGTLQMYFAGTWGTVVGYNWDYHNARTACRQLGWETGAAVATSGAVYGNIIGPVWPTQYECGWEENRLSSCPAWYELNTNTWLDAEDARMFNDTAGVICRNGRLLIQMTRVTLKMLHLSSTAYDYTFYWITGRMFMQRPPPTPALFG